MSLRSMIFPAIALMVSVIGCQGKVDNEDLDNVGSGAQSDVTPCATPERSCDPSGGTGTDGVMGVQYCVENDAGDEEWTACCTFDIASCECEPPWAGDDWECNTPLVLAFENQSVRYTTEMAGSFDMTGLGLSVAMDWPTAATPWLAIDRDGNGRIDDGSELFGTATRVGRDQRAPNGFFALAALDENEDGVIDAKDSAFSKLLVWRDADANRTSDAKELSPVANELSSIALAYKVDSKCDGRGNCEVERAEIRFLSSDGQERTGSVVDVHLRKQP